MNKSESMPMKIMRMNIAWRLITAFELLTVLILGLAVLSLTQMAQMKTNTGTITKRWLPSAMAVQRMNTQVVEMRSLEIQHVLNFSEQAMEEISRGMDANQTAFKGDAETYSAAISDDQERKTFDGFLQAWKAYMKSHGELMQLSSDNSKDAARSLLEDSATKAQYAAARQALSTLVLLNEQGANVAVGKTSTAFDRSIITLIVVTLVAVLLALGASVWLITSITRPLKVAVGVADKVANGDLTARIETRATDETGQLLQALARMQSSLVSIAITVRRSATSVATACTQIAQGTADLSDRTERQASALQETAATMEELGSTARHNVDHAVRAQQLVETASIVAEDGGEVIGQVISTMAQIDEGSKRIQDIIGLIDGIAFQTNILALNAAVESARAGSHGRGFAVVAAEVGDLAQRSAAAARRIKDLIASSVTHVEQGTVLAGRAGVTMNEVVAAVNHVSQIVSEIRSASVEQGHGVTQAAQAISEMDSTTQKNAALVEESTAAAESLRREAQQLLHALDAFKLEGAQAPGADEVDAG